jgi:1,4-alpha-glucan branching enzyme
MKTRSVSSVASKTKAAGEKAARCAGSKEIKRRYLKDGEKCKVTFKLPKAAVTGAYRIMLVGEFNDWSVEATPLKRLMSGDFSVTVELPVGREYRYRYLINEDRWENDWCADKYVENHFGEEDSVVVV